MLSMERLFFVFFPFSSIFAFVRTTLHSGFFCQSAGDSMTGTCGYPEKKEAALGSDLSSH